MWALAPVPVRVAVHESPGQLGRGCLRLGPMLSPVLLYVSHLGCSTTVVGRLASSTGAVFASHSNDGDGCFCHSSVNRVLASDWPAGATRRVKGHKIPQVSHTYAYHTEGYAAMNEHQVGLAESTCSGRHFPATHVSRSGFMDIVQLGQLALERANSSRRAVQVMGDLAETYGYSDATESLLVIDSMEAFIFQIMSDDTGNSSVWVAQRVPDDHVGSVTNGLTVRIVDFADPKNFMFSSTIQEVALRHKLWERGTPFDFTKIYAEGGISEPSAGGQPYVSRRMWAAYRRFGTTADIGNGTYRDFIMDAPLPATVPVPRGSVRLQDVMGVMRDYYEGTPYDMTVGMAAGHGGSPDRFGGCSDCVAKNETVSGSWERTIATHHSIVSLVLEARSWLPDPVGGTLWFAPHAAHTSVYAPFPCGMNDLPATYSNSSGWSDVPPEHAPVAAWANRAVFGAVQSNFRAANKTMTAARAELDNASLALQARTDAAFKAGSMTMPAIECVACLPAMAGLATSGCTHNRHVDMLYRALFRHNADSIVASWWQLHNQLALTQQTDAGYPAWWLKSPDVKYTLGVVAAVESAAANNEEAAPHDLMTQLHAAQEQVRRLEHQVAQLRRARNTTV